MNTDKYKIFKDEILRTYSKDLPSKYYAMLRLRLSPIMQIEKYIPKSGNILDLGCGSGIFAYILYLGSSNRKVLGIDISTKRIEIAQYYLNKYPQLKFISGDVNSISFDDFGVITLIDLLHHMPFSEQHNLLQKVYDKLHYNGLLFIKDLEKAPYWKYIFHYIQDSISYKGERLYFRSSKEMVNLLEGIGFQTETISMASGYPHPHVLYKCTKKNEY